MNHLLVAAALLSALQAQPLPVVPLQVGSPDQLAQNLREKRPISPADCRALNLWECHPDDPNRITDIAIRWVQLDEDPQLEAVIVTQAPSENTYAAYIFDKQRTWNLVGSFFDRQWTSDGQDYISVRKLTEDSPSLLLVLRDLGGSGSVIFTTEAFRLYQGQLWPAISVTNLVRSFLPAPGGVTRQHMLSSPARLILHTINVDLSGRTLENTCEAWRWMPARHAFAKVPTESRTFCNMQTGKPIAGKANPVDLKRYL